MTKPTTYKLGFPKLGYPTVPLASGSPFQRDPTSSDLRDTANGGYYQIGTVWPNEATGAIWMLGSISNGTTANWLAITEPASGDVVGPASSTDTALAVYNGITGKLIRNSVATLSATGVLSFPAGGGPVLTTGGAAARKGTFTLVAGTLAAPIATTAALTGSVIVYTVVTLGTVTIASAFKTTIVTGVSFTPVASQITDTSTVNWAIVA